MAEAFDTLRTSKELQACGLGAAESEGIATAINGAIVGNLATKTDIELLEEKIENASLRTRVWIISGFIVTIGAIKALDYLIPLVVP